MKRHILSLARTTLILATVGLNVQAALADTAADARQVNQSQRIATGINSGQLTQAEQDRLHTQQARIATGEARVASDGEVTKREKRKLNARQKNASQHIAHAKHDRQMQPK